MRRTVAAVLLIVPALAACSSGSFSAGRLVPHASTSTPVATASGGWTPDSSASPSPTASTWATSSALAERSLTESDLKPLLLNLKDDAPPGFSDETDTLKDKSVNVRFSGPPACQPLVTRLNADKPNGSRAQAAVVLSGGAQGPVITEFLDAMGSEVRAGDEVTAWRNAVRECPVMKGAPPKEKPIDLTVRPVNAPGYGSGPFAFRITAKDPRVSDFEGTQVVTREKDVLVTLQFEFATPDDIDGATETAWDNVATNLPTGGPHVN